MVTGACLCGAVGYQIEGGGGGLPEKGLSVDARAGTERRVPNALWVPEVVLSDVRVAGFLPRFVEHAPRTR